MDATTLLVAMTTGLCDTNFLKLAELIVGKTEWRANKPRPCIRDWVSLENGHAGKNIEHYTEIMTTLLVGKMIKSQQPEFYMLISELRKYLRPLNKRDYPFPADSQIKTWEENGVMKHNVKILHKRDELMGLVDPIRKRVGFSEKLTFTENKETRASYNYMMKSFDTANSIISIDSIVYAPKNERDAIPRLPNNRLAELIGKAFEKRR
jgi:hypothetical protein